MCFVILQRDPIIASASTDPTAAKRSPNTNLVVRLRSKNANNFSWRPWAKCFLSQATVLYIWYHMRNKRVKMTLLQKRKETFPICCEGKQSGALPFPKQSSILVERNTKLSVINHIILLLVWWFQLQINLFTWCGWMIHEFFFCAILDTVDVKN